MNAINSTNFDEELNKGRIPRFFERKRINRVRNTILATLLMTLNGILIYINFSEWHIVKIQGRAAEYPFGGEGPTPYYYKTAELYSHVKLIWGFIFLIVFLFSIWAVLKRKRKLTMVLFGLTLYFILVLFIQGRIGIN
ncbi:hypothetical protein [Echinicola sediminis]